MTELTATVVIESLLRATADDATPIIRRLARNQARVFLDSRAGDAGEPVAWQWERRGRYGPTDGATIGKWERVLTPYAPDTWPEADRRNIVPLYAATPAPAVDAVPAGEVDALRVDWNRRELADAYDMVEGMRQQIAQPAESPLNQSLLTVMDALEAADVEWSGITKTDRSSEA